MTLTHDQKIGAWAVGTVAAGLICWGAFGIGAGMVKSHTTPAPSPSTATATVTLPAPAPSTVSVTPAQATTVITTPLDNSCKLLVKYEGQIESALGKADEIASKINDLLGEIMVYRTVDPQRITALEGRLDRLSSQHYSHWLDAKEREADLHTQLGICRHHTGG